MNARINEKIKFAVTRWDETAIEEEREQFPVKKAHVEYELTGNLKGKAYVEYLLDYVNENRNDGHLSTANVLGFLVFEGEYKGEKCSFVASEQGLFDKGQLECPGKIIRGTGYFTDKKGQYSYAFEEEESYILLELN